MLVLSYIGIVQLRPLYQVQNELLLLRLELLRHILPFG
jgi:hypothetical protein